MREQWNLMNNELAKLDLENHLNSCVTMRVCTIFTVCMWSNCQISEIHSLSNSATRNWQSATHFNWFREKWPTSNLVVPWSGNKISDKITIFRRYEALEISIRKLDFLNRIQPEHISTKLYNIGYMREQWKVMNNELVKLDLENDLNSCVTMRVCTIYTVCMWSNCQISEI